MILVEPTALQARMIVHNMTQAVNPPCRFAFCLFPCLEADGVVFNTAKPRDPARSLFLDGHFA